MDLLRHQEVQRASGSCVPAGGPWTLTRAGGRTASSSGRAPGATPACDVRGGDPRLDELLVSHDAATRPHVVANTGPRRPRASSASSAPTCTRRRPPMQAVAGVSAAPARRRARCRHDRRRATCAPTSDAGRARWSRSPIPSAGQGRAARGDGRRAVASRTSTRCSTCGVDVVSVCTPPHDARRPGCARDRGRPARAVREADRARRSTTADRIVEAAARRQGA